MEIQVNRDVWEGISPQERQQIEQILKDAGAIGAADRIVANQGVELFAAQNLPTADGPCQAACTATYGRATRVCSALPHPGLRAACYAAAMAAYAVCLRNC